jgi:protocatechuate 3,4-dioxygenase beta subunit
MNDEHTRNQAGQASAGLSSQAAPRITRRAALKSWITRTAPLLLLAACAGPAAAGVSTSSSTRTGAATGGASANGTSAGAASTPAASTVAQAGLSQATSGLAASHAASAAPQTGLSQPGSVRQTASVQQSLPACVITPQQTEGPYFVDERMNRSDIRSDPADGSVREGVPLRLTMQITQVSGSACAPLAGVYVDLWQCDALGVYSDVNDRSTGSRAGASKFLRGYQVTDENGIIQFTTIYPGWYQGRTVHIHFKVRTALDSRSAREMTSQLYFDDALTDQIHALPPYASKGQRTMRNNQDGIYRDGGDKLTVPVAPEGDGYAGTFNLGVQLT